ncbi:citrate lyase holo-[acyl-carrier protein] synthase [Nguyenibacter vanlangensis]|uniref:citrate lyase holo-[acyl-carrier protein] synthase n=1 Tax=Nguyenibacter vanlangensis TaxID=1216886 RepID=A0ABZ3D056_9PROT
MGAADNRVSLEQILDAREQRAIRQAQVRARFGKAVVSITLVAPGPVKDSSRLRTVFQGAIAAVEAAQKQYGWPCRYRAVTFLETGPEALYVFDADIRALKSHLVFLENTMPLGRLWDLDVIGADGQSLSRKESGFDGRKCLVCNAPAFECGRSRKHSLVSLTNAVKRIIDNADVVIL